MKRMKHHYHTASLAHCTSLSRQLLAEMARHHHCAQWNALDCPPMNRIGLLANTTVSPGSKMETPLDNIRPGFACKRKSRRCDRHWGTIKLNNTHRILSRRKIRKRAQAVLLSPLLCQGVGLFITTDSYMRRDMEPLQNALVHVQSCHNFGPQPRISHQATGPTPPMATPFQRTTQGPFEHLF